MYRQFLLLVGLGLSLAACQQEPEQRRVTKDEPRPALWQISDADGAVEGWLFGTIHALPDDIAWRSPRLDRTIEQADMLVVEVSDLEDSEALSALFEEMAFDRPSPPVAARIGKAHGQEFDKLLVKARVRRDYFDRMESWAAALALAQVAQSARTENGADRILLTAFKDREVVELEGARQQLAIFDGLPEREQRDLLDAVLAESAAREAEKDEMARAWQRGETEKLERLTRAGILSDPELKQALLVDRNTAWAAQIENLLSTDDRPLIAVGAGHLFGGDGLPALLEARGYRVERVE